VYPVGTPGKPWGDDEQKEWLGRQSKKRDYFTEVVSKLLRFNNGDLFQYGELDYRKFGSAKFPLFGIRSRNWDESNPLVLVTGGTHGYETSGVQGALLFIEKHLHEVRTDKVNVLVLPCLSPWGYEMIHRWTPEAIDPNRCFKPENPGCQEAALAMKCAQEYVAKSNGILMHTDLHETTDTDNSEFQPSLCARNGTMTPEWNEIPDGYYLVANDHTPEPEFMRAVINAVEKVTHIAPPDENGNIIGEKITDKGVITIAGRHWGVCGSHTAARFSVTTEVYPDSPNANDEKCNQAQVATILAGIEFALNATP